MRSHYGVVPRELVCEIIVTKSELHSRYYIHIRTSNIRKCMGSLICQLWIK